MCVPGATLSAISLLWPLGGGPYLHPYSSQSCVDFSRHSTVTLILKGLLCFLIRSCFEGFQCDWSHAGGRDCADCKLSWRWPWCQIADGLVVWMKTDALALQLGWKSTEVWRHSFITDPNVVSCRFAPFKVRHNYIKLLCLMLQHVTCCYN